MFFRRKGWLRREYDEKLFNQLEDLKLDRNRQKSLIEKSFDPSEEIVIQAKIAEAKYFYLFREAKKRKISLRK